MFKKLKSPALMILVTALTLTCAAVLAAGDSPFGFAYCKNHKIQLTEGEFNRLREVRREELKKIVEEKVLKGEISQEDADRFLEKQSQCPFLAAKDDKRVIQEGRRSREGFGKANERHRINRQYNKIWGGRAKAGETIPE